MQYKFGPSGNIRPLTLDRKEKYEADLCNIENSWSGRGDCFTVCNTFIQEACQLLHNSLSLFEQGFFDCAFFALRSAIEVSTTIVYLADMPDDTKEDSMHAWKKKRRFPMRKDMLKALAQNVDAFADMRHKMDDFFGAAEKLCNELHKYVHKQGFEYFYVSRNHLLERHKPLDDFILQFEDYFKKAVGTVAVMRLAIDPFPVLLMDDEICHRCFEALTEPYSADFVGEYIGWDTISSFKSTVIYCEPYNYFMGFEYKNEAVYNISHHFYIDTAEESDIMEQIHLLDETAAVSTMIALSMAKTTKIYSHDGISQYFTDRPTKRTRLEFSSADFVRFRNSENPQNQKYNEAYITVFSFDGETYWIEHNDLLSEDEISQVYTSVNQKIAHWKRTLGIL